jgi:hypothetical protein
MSNLVTLFLTFPDISLNKRGQITQIDLFLILYFSTFSIMLKILQEQETREI